MELTGRMMEEQGEMEEGEGGISSGAAVEVGEIGGKMPEVGDGEPMRRRRKEWEAKTMEER